LFDYRAYIKVEALSQIPKGLKAYIIFEPLEDSYTAQSFRKMVSKVMLNLGPNKEIESVRIMGEPGRTVGMVELPDDQETKALYEFLNSPSRKGSFKN